MPQGASPAVLWAFAGYLALVIAIGILSSRFSSRGLGEYFLAGRNLNRWVVALSAVVSGRSSWLLLGLSGLAYTRGASAIWAAVGYVAVEFVLFWSYAGRLRRFSERYDCITLPDFFAARFEDRSGLLRGLLVCVFLVFLPTYVAAQFVAGGKLFSASFGWSETGGVYITAAIVLVYTVLGGFLAVSWTDMLQALFMILALVVLPLVGLGQIGGWSELVQQLDPTLVDPLHIGFGALIGFVGIGLGSPGNPHILVRYMSIDDPKQLRTSAVVGTVWNVVMAVGAVAIGVVGRAYFPALSDVPGGDSEKVYAALGEELFPPFVFGILLASVFAAIMSTADSQLLVAASAIVRDLYEKVFARGREIDSHVLVRASRVVVVLLVGVSVVLGLTGENVIFWFVLLAWAGMGAALGPTSILALYWRGTTRAGVAAGIVSGAATVYVWRAYLREDYWNLYELIPGFAVALAITFLVSRLGAPPRDVERMFASMEPADGEPGRSPRERVDSGS